MPTEIILFLAAQAAALFVAIIATYVRTAVRLREIELMLRHTDGASTSNASALSVMQTEIQKLTVKVEHIQTTQQMLCTTCPLRGNKHVKVEVAPS